MHLRPALPLAFVALAACTDEVNPEWTRLAAGWTPDQLEGSLVMPDGTAARADPEGGGMWLDFSLAGGSFRRDPTETRPVWAAPIPELPGGGHLFGLRTTVVAGGAPIPKSDIKTRKPGDSEGAMYLLSNTRLKLLLPEGATPFDRIVLSVLVPRGHQRAGVWRAPIGAAIADGLSVWPGERTAITTRFPAHSALRFQIAGTPWDAESESVTFRIRVDDELVFEHEYVFAQDPGRVRCSVTLPRTGSSSARVEFYVSGDAATTAFLAPVIGPLDIGSPGARPWKVARPDIVLFVADTLRADQLEPWRADAGPAPAPDLDTFAQKSRRFLGARAPATSTLPSHGSLFTGLFPLQHGALNGKALPASFTLLAELLTRVGYRTAAVTNSGFTSRQFGFDRGFETYDERAFSDRTLAARMEDARAARAADDGRPLFLFVHTYRVHTPFRTGLDESTTELESFRERTREYVRSHAAAGDANTLEAAHLEFGDEYFDLYRAGVLGLNDAVAPWLAELETERFFEHGTLIFTSDHGEEFLEHGGRGHGGPAFEECVRIPLLMRGPRTPPGDVPWPCSLMDLTPTIAALGLAPAAPEWIGTSLLELERERPMLYYNENDAGRHLAASSGTRKLFFTDADFEAGPIAAAFDLENDPGELEDLAAGGAQWPEELRAELLPLWKLLSHPAGDAASGEIDAALFEDLRELGYVE